MASCVFLSHCYILKWYYIIKKAIDSYQDIAILLLETVNLPCSYRGVTYCGVF